MKLWTLKELLSLTRTELFVLHRSIAAEMARFPEQSADYRIALMNLRNIRLVLARLNLRP